LVYKIQYIIVYSVKFLPTSRFHIRVKCTIPGPASQLRHHTKCILLPSLTPVLIFLTLSIVMT